MERLFASTLPIGALSRAALCIAISRKFRVIFALGVETAHFVALTQAMTAFEDTLNNQHRSTIEQLPVEALFGEKLPKDGQRELLPHFYRYFDFCNEQAFLFSHGRVSKKTWRNWEEGIKSNLARPAFETAWTEVARRSVGDFSALRKLCPSLGKDDFCEA